MKEQAQAFEKEAALCFEMAATSMRRQFPDYGEAERMMSRAQACIKYARQCNNGTFKGEEW